MGGALQQCAVQIEELPWHPVQWNAHMGAAIPVGVELVVLTNGKQLAFINLQFNAL